MGLRCQRAGAGAVSVSRHAIEKDGTTWLMVNSLLCRSGRNAAPAVSAAAREEINTLRMQLEDLTEHSLTLEKERDFYFGKVSRVPHSGLRRSDRNNGLIVGRVLCEIAA